MRALVYPPKFIVGEDKEERGGDGYSRNVVMYASGTHGDGWHDGRSTVTREYVQYVLDGGIEVGGRRCGVAESGER